MCPHIFTAQNNLDPFTHYYSVFYLIFPKIDCGSDLLKLPWKYYLQNWRFKQWGCYIKPYFKWIIDISCMIHKYKCSWHSDVLYIKQCFFKICKNMVITIWTVNYYHLCLIIHYFIIDYKKPSKPKRNFTHTPNFGFLSWFHVYEDLRFFPDYFKE